MANSFVHMELATPNLEAAKKFYGEMFKWSFQDMPMGEGSVYSMFRPDTAPAGGMFSLPGVPTMWLAYIGVDDIHAAAAKAKELGATIVRDVQEVMGYGWQCVLQDPTGAMIALWQGNQQGHAA